MKKIIKFLINPSYEVESMVNYYRKLRSASIMKRLIMKKMATKYGVYIGRNSVIGSNIKIPHHTSIVIGDRVQIGNDVTIYQGVTIGVVNNKNIIKADNNKNIYPIIKNGVTIYANTTIVGNVIIGENSIIGANSFVNTDIESNSIYIGQPARKIKTII